MVEDHVLVAGGVPGLERSEAPVDQGIVEFVLSHRSFVVHAVCHARPVPRRARR
jgi:hypothetical protein